ncbi:MAG: hypothetical protein E6G67_00175 [Actinobacteria bacterium]|nr:MAG: hypothetical protein E6G67_00175 [Actinomycetota bacterium]
MKGPGTTDERFAEPPSDDVLRGLVARARERGEERVVIEVTHEVADAWAHAGFAEVSRTLAASVEVLERRLSRDGGPSFGSIHVQTDDLDAVVRAVRQYVPRLPGHSRGSVVVPPRDGWTAVYDELCDRDPEMLRRLGREISDRTGAVVLVLGLEDGAVVRYIALERGRIVDEYLSVPEYQGPLAPGDVIALGANPRLMARLTGAEIADVREAAPTAADPAELPPAADLLARLARTFGIQGGTHGYDGALDAPGAIAVERPLG